MTDRDRNAFAGTEDFWRVEAKVDACRCAGCNDVAGLQGETCGNRRHQRRDAEDQVARIGILAKLAVHPAFDVEILGIDRWSRSMGPSDRMSRAICPKTTACDCAGDRGR